MFIYVFIQNVKHHLTVGGPVLRYHHTSTLQAVNYILETCRDIFYLLDRTHLSPQHSAHSECVCFQYVLYVLCLYTSCLSKILHTFVLQTA